jgi:hypothetical protein
VLFLPVFPAQAEVYLSPYDGAGTEANPFKSRCYGIPGGRGVDIRADAKQATGHAVCESTNLPANMTEVVFIGSTRKASLTAQVKNNILTATGKTIVGNTVEEAIKELVIPILRLPKSGEYTILLGKTQPPIKTAATFLNDVHYKGFATAVKEHGVAFARSVTQSTVAWATTLATETFTSSDGNLTGCLATGCTHDWDEFSGTAMVIASNQASATGTTTTVARMTTPVDTVDMTASVTLVNATRGGAGTLVSCSVLIRKENNATATFYRNIVAIRSSGELNSTELSKSIAAAITSLDTDTTDWVANDALAVSANDDAIEGTLAGVSRTSATDASITAGTYAGFRFSSDSASGNCAWDNLIVADITTSSGGILRRRAF